MTTVVNICKKCLCALDLDTVCPVASGFQHVCKACVTDWTNSLPASHSGFTGMRETFYSSGVRETTSEWKNGQLHGVFTEFYQSGIVKLTAQYENGCLHGIFERWSEDGLKLSTVNFHGHELHGEVCFSTVKN